MFEFCIIGWFSCWPGFELVWFIYRLAGLVCWLFIVVNWFGFAIHWSLFICVIVPYKLAFSCILGNCAEGIVHYRLGVVSKEPY